MNQHRFDIHEQYLNLRWGTLTLIERNCGGAEGGLSVRLEGVLQNDFHLRMILLNDGNLHRDARKDDPSRNGLDSIHLQQRRKAAPEVPGDPDVSPRNRDEADRVPHHCRNVLREDLGHAPFFRPEAAMHLYEAR